MVGRPRLDDSEDIGRLVVILSGEATTFRKACRRVYDMEDDRDESFENFCARLYAKRAKEITPLLNGDDPQESEEIDEVPTPPAPSFRP